jgi:2-oxoglutarate ferredoxin oxidoreductase subunit beta
MTDIPVTDSLSYTRKDFVSDQTVRWCPGCGDYAILAAVQKVLPDIGVPREDIVFISGIGCSSRFPYYMNTYGIHSIHGRAPTLATGLKIANPDLSVWVVTGDGDGLSIGGNHLLHACRRNIDLQILLFNNRIYGLTKGQYSPTSLPGTKTKSSPMGAIDHPFNPIAVTLGAGASFIARTLDTHQKHMGEVLADAAAHRGSSFVEILQNCPIFNDKAWEHVADRKQQPETILYLEHGQPLVFGQDRDKGIRLNGVRPEVVELGNGISEDNLMVHDETNENIAYILSQMDWPAFPVPFGVIYRVNKSTYDSELSRQIHEAQDQKGSGDLRKLYNADYTWTVRVDDEINGHRVPEHLEAVSDISSLDEQYVDAVIHGETDDVSDSKSAVHGMATDPLASLLHRDRELVTISPETSLDEAVRLLQEKDVGALIVVDSSQRPIGIFTEADVLKKIAVQIEDLSAHVVADFMTRDPDVFPAHVPIVHTLNVMSNHRYRHVPVVDERGILLDVVSFRDVVNYIESYFDDEA